MNYLIPLFFLFFAPLFSNEYLATPIASIDADPNAIIDGCIDLMSGQFVDFETDLVIPGGEPLLIQRMYRTNPGCCGRASIAGTQWEMRHQGRIFSADNTKIDKKHKAKKGSYSGPFGEYLEHHAYETRGQEVVGMTVKDEFLHSGVTNLSKGVVGAISNCRNNSYFLSKSSGTGTYITSDGTELKFNEVIQVYQGTKLARLTEEFLPSSLKRVHHNGKVILQNKNGKELSYYVENRWNDGEYEKRSVTAPDGRNVIYRTKRKSWKVGYEDDDKYKPIKDKVDVLKTVNSTDRPKISYEYAFGKSYEVEGKYYEGVWKEERTMFQEPSVFYHFYHRISEKRLPDDRVLAVRYFDETTGQKFTDKLFARVKELLAPIGAGKELITKYTFQYGFGGNTLAHVIVLDALKRRQEYHFGGDSRLRAIVRYDENNQPYSIETLTFGPARSTSSHQLYARTFGKTGVSQKIFTKCYSYDGIGNIVEEKLYGNITGNEKRALEVHDNGVPKEGTYEHLVKRYSYTNDRFNLLKESITPKIKEIYGYIPGTNLVKFKFKTDLAGNIFMREFFQYDENSAVIEQITDDGNSQDENSLEAVTLRRVEKITRSEVYPIGLPLVVEVYYLNQKSKDLEFSSKQVNTFNSKGELLKREHYDKDHLFVFDEEWSYDPHGNLLTFKNGLGEIEERCYDANDNLIFLKGFDKRYQTLYTYDFSNRLIKEEEIHEDGSFVKQYRYDLLGNQVAVVDALGHETNFEYDAFNRIVKVIEPKLINQNGELEAPISFFSYDAMGNKKEIVDPLGNKTSFEYTLFGKPFHVTYPDGGEEWFEYDLEGNLIKEIKRNGSIVLYQRDCLARVVKQEVFSSEGVLLSSHEFTYSAFHLLSEKDPMGVIKYYTYDSFGRKVTEVKGDSIICFEYDSLGRVFKTIYGSLKNELEGFQKCVGYDVLNRVIEEKEEDLEGNLLTWKKMRYDSLGRVISTEMEGSVTRAEYDSHGNLSSSFDALGNVTKSIIDYEYRNEFSQRVLCCDKIDPLGRIKREIYDTKGRVVETIILSPFQDVLQRTRQVLDPLGKSLKIIEDVMEDGEKKREVVTEFEYNKMGMMTLLREGSRTHEERTTEIYYNIKGEKERVVKRSSITLNYRYDQMGRVIETYSSDGTIHYKTTYDKNGNPIRIDDLVHGSSLKKEYNEMNRMVHEKLPTGITLNLTYTSFGAVSSATFASGIQVKYNYQGNRLKKVERLDSRGSVLYDQTYDAFSLRGELKEASLIHGLGKINYEYNARGEVVEISSPYLTEKLSYNELGSITERVRDYQKEKFDYDPLNQITKEPDHTYRYDSLCNRVEMDGKLFSFNGLNERLSNDETKVAYDLSGNLILEENFYDKKEMKYDALDRLTSLKVNGRVVAYEYDGCDRIVAKKVYYGGALYDEEKFIYLGLNDVGTIDYYGKVSNFRVLGKGKAGEIGASIAIEMNEYPYAVLHDHTGSVLKLISKRGVVWADYAYTVFGEEKNKSQLVENPYRFASKRSDEGFVLFGRRFYDAASGRWLSRDPIGREGGANLYAFVSNSPLTYFDAFGLREDSESLHDRERAHYRDHGHRGEGPRRGTNSTDRMIRSGRESLGSAVESVGRQIVPVPVVKEVFRFVGHFIEKMTWRGFKPTWKNEKSQSIYIGEGDLQRVGLYGNGLSTPVENAVNAASLLAIHSGSRLNLMYNNDHGTMEAVLETVMIKFGFVTESCRQALALTRKTIDSLKEGQFVWIQLHSQSAEIGNWVLTQLTDDQKAKCLVSTYGGARLIDNSDKKFAYCMNNVSRHDPISLIADPFGYAKALMGLRDDVNFVPAKSAGFEHGMVETYFDVVKDELRELSKRYGY